MNKKHKIIVAVTGASGAIYAKVLFDKLLQLNNQIEKIGVIMSNNAKFVWEQELGNTNYKKYPFTFYKTITEIAIPYIYQEDEIFDLIAYILSGGDSNSRMFRGK